MGKDPAATLAQLRISDMTGLKLLITVTVNYTG